MAKKVKKKRKNGRKKGACGEREAAALLSKYNLPDGTPVVAKRMARSGLSTPDLEHNINDVHFEVKRDEAIDIGTSMLLNACLQADRYGLAKGMRYSYVLWRRNGGRWRISYIKSNGLVWTTGAHDMLTKMGMRLRDAS